MSFDTHKYWVYQIVGRNIHLWQHVYAAAVDTLGSYKIRLPGEYYGKQLVYPDESITDGLMYEGTAFISPFVDVDPNELSGNDNPSLVEQTSPDENDHVNLSRMLSLAVVDYLRAQLAEKGGDVQKKEYYMREFWKKVGDNESNKRKISMSFPMSPFGVR
jgi:hypothetical protein